MLAAKRVAEASKASVDAVRRTLCERFTTAKAVAEVSQAGWERMSRVLLGKAKRGAPMPAANINLSKSEMFVRENGFGFWHTPGAPTLYTL